jgi:hypothetical protein
MKAKDFVEIEEAKFAQQLHSFWKGLQQYGAALGFSNAEIDDAEKDYRWMDYVINRNAQVQAYAQSYTSFKKLLRHGAAKPMVEMQLSNSLTPPATPVNGNIEKRFRKRASKAKSSPNYSESTGEALHIVAPRQEFDKAKAKPQFKVILVGGRPHIKFKKKHFEAFDIYKDSGGGFKKLERVSRSPYVDEGDLPPAGQSTAWKYTLIGVVRDKQIGQVSDEVVTVVYN